MALTDIRGGGYPGGYAAWADSVGGTNAQYLAEWGGDQSEGWPAPAPLDIHSTLPFPTNALPDVLREWVSEEAKATQTPHDLAGVLAFAALSAAVARKAIVRISATWREPLNLYVAVVMDVGSRKSAVFADAVEPLRIAERHLVERHAPGVRDRQQERRILETEMAAAEKKTAVTSGDDKRIARDDARRLAEQIAAIGDPQPPALLADDFTPEALTQLLAEQGGRLGVFSDEGGVFANVAGRYSRGVPNLDAMLKCHSGFAEVRVNRRGRPTEFVHHPALAFGLAIQPDVLRELGQTPALRGRGLLARFLWSVPARPPVLGDLDPPAVGVATAAAFARLLGDFAEGDLPPVDQQRVLTLDSAATELFQSFRRQFRPRLEPDFGDLADVRDWGSKQEGAVARLAALLALAEKPGAMSVGEAPMAAAVAVGDYFTSHAQVAFDIISGHDYDPPAASVLRWLRAKGLVRFSIREAHSQLRGQARFRQAEQVRAAVEVLRERGYIRPVAGPQGGVGRPPSPTFEIHPLVRPQNPHNPAWGAPEQSSVHFVDGLQ